MAFTVKIDGKNHRFLRYRKNRVLSNYDTKSRITIPPPQNRVSYSIVVMIRYGNSANSNNYYKVGDYFNVSKNFLGRGTFGKVYMISDKKFSEWEFVLKQIKLLVPDGNNPAGKKWTDLRMLNDEISIMRDHIGVHPLFPNLQDVFLEYDAAKPEDAALNLVMDYSKGGF